MTSPYKRPEGDLLSRLRKRAPQEISQRAAAQLAGISEGRWRQIEAGYSSPGRGQRVEVIAPADTLARMVRVLGGTEDELRDAQREDAAEQLTQLGGPDTSFVSQVGVAPGETSNAEILEAIRQMREAVDRLAEEIRRDRS